MDVARTSPEKNEVLVRMTWVRKCHVPYVFTNQKKYLPSILFQANVKYSNKPFTMTGNKAKKQREKDCFAVLLPIAGNSCLILFLNLHFMPSVAEIFNTSLSLNFLCC